MARKIWILGRDEQGAEMTHVQTNMDDILTKQVCAYNGARRPLTLLAGIRHRRNAKLRAGVESFEPVEVAAAAAVPEEDASARAKVEMPAIENPVPARARVSWQLANGCMDKIIQTSEPMF